MEGRTRTGFKSSINLLQPLQLSSTRKPRFQLVCSTWSLYSQTSLPASGHKWRVYLLPRLTRQKTLLPNRLKNCSLTRAKPGGPFLLRAHLWWLLATEPRFWRPWPSLRNGRSWWSRRDLSSPSKSILTRFLAAFTFAPTFRFLTLMEKFQTPLSAQSVTAQWKCSSATSVATMEILLQMLEH